MDNVVKAAMDKEKDPERAADSDAESRNTSEISDQELKDMMRDLENESDEDEDQKVKEGRKRKAKQVLLEFAQLSTTHGIGHVGEAHTRPVMLFWILLLLVCLGLFVFLFSQTLLTFLEYGVNVEITMKSDERYFPAVTICNMSPYKEKALMKVPSLAALVYAFKFALEEKQDKLLEEWPMEEREAQGICDMKLKYCQA